MSGFAGRSEFAMGAEGTVQISNRRGTRGRFIRSSTVNSSARSTRTNRANTDNGAVDCHQVMQFIEGGSSDARVKRRIEVGVRIRKRTAA